MKDLYFNGSNKDFTIKDLSFNESNKDFTIKDLSFNESNSGFFFVLFGGARVIFSREIRFASIPRFELGSCLGP